MILQKRIIFKKTPLNLPLFVFLLSQVISTVFSIDTHTSIFGYYSRFNGGLLSIVSFIFLYWALVTNSTKKDVLRFIKVSFASAFLVSFYGILEHFGHSFSCLLFERKFDVSCWIQDVQARVFATIGQPNWLAAYLAVLLPVSLAFSLNHEQGITNKEKKYLSSLIHYPLFIILFLCLLFTGSRSGFLGLIAALAAFWLFFFLTRKNLNLIIKPIVSNALVITFCLLIFGTPFSQINRYLQIKNWFSKPEPVNKQEIVATPVEPQLEAGGTESGIIRKIVWTGAVNIFKAHPILGTGPETFAYSYYNFRPMEHNLVSEWDFLYNKAHNEYLNYLSTTGILGLGTYLTFIAAFIIWNIRQFPILNFKFLNKKETDNPLFMIQYSLFAGWVSILVSNFFGFSVVLVSLYFYLIPAFCFVLNEKEIAIKEQSFVKPKLLLVPLLLVTCYLVLAAINLWRADYYYSLGQKLNRRNDFLNGYQNLAKAVEISPNEPVFLNELSSAAANTALLSFLQKDENAIPLAEAAYYYSELAFKKSTKNLNLYKSRVKVLYTLSQIDEKYLDKSIETIKKAIVLAPTDPKLVYNLGLLYGRKGMVEEALEQIIKSIEMKPNYEEARNALAIFYEDLGMNKEALEQLEIIYMTKKDDPSLLERIENLKNQL